MESAQYATILLTVIETNVQLEKTTIWNWLSWRQANISFQKYFKYYFSSRKVCEIVLQRWITLLFQSIFGERGAKGDWDFRISDLVKNPYGTDI